MGDACETCGGTGKVGSKTDKQSGPQRPCWACGGTGMTAPAPRRRRDR